jgi:RimJ/RimL family protein N-acetyltransferase
MDARNERAGHLLRSLGFRQEGHLRDSCFLHGEWTSEYVYGLLDSD